MTHKKTFLNKYKFSSDFYNVFPSFKKKKHTHRKKVNIKKYLQISGIYHTMNKQTMK